MTVLRGKDTAYAITSLHVYPVKACAGYSVDAAVMTSRGFENDRLYVIVAADGTFLTQRELPAMCLIRPILTDNGLRFQCPGQPEISVPLQKTVELKSVTVWNDTCLGHDQGQAIADWLSSYLGRDCRLVRMSDEHPRPIPQQYGKPDDIVSFADGFPFLVTNEASLDDLNGRLDAPVSMDRFRPSIVVRGATAFEEDNWISLSGDNTDVEFLKSCARCVVTATDQKTSQRGLEPLKTLSKYRKFQDNEVLFGHYAVPRRLGTVTVGELVQITAKGSGEH